MGDDGQQPEWTAEMEAELSGDPAQAAEVGEPETEPETADDGRDGFESVEEERDWFKKRLGQRENEHAEQMRELKREVEQMREQFQAPQQPDPDDPEIREKTFDRWMSRWDPRYGDLKEVDGYKADREPMFNMARDLLEAIGQIRAEVQQQFSQIAEQNELAASGVTPDVVQRMTEDPSIAALWQNANAEQKKALARMVGGDASGPSGQGPSSRSATDRSTMIESSGATTPQNNRRTSADDMVMRKLEEGDLKGAGSFVDQLLGEQLQGVKRR